MRRPAILACCTVLAASAVLLLGRGAPSVAARQPPHLATFSCHVDWVIDADTFRCTDGTLVRVAGIDARQRDGSCAPGHRCAAGSARAATEALGWLISTERLTCRADGTTYNRLAAWCRRSDGVDVSCAMLLSGTVAKWDRYWRGHRC